MDVTEMNDILYIIVNLSETYKLLDLVIKNTNDYLQNAKITK